MTEKKEKPPWWTPSPIFEGVPFKLGGHEIVVPAVNFSRAKKLLPVLERLRDAQLGVSINQNQLDDFIEVIFTAVSRNYPEVSKAALEDLVDFNNAPRLFMTIMGAGGFLQGENLPGMASLYTGGASIPD